MSPSTPPGWNHDVPFTPRTPRYGPLDEPDFYPRRTKAVEPSSHKKRLNTHTDHLLTPEETPARKKHSDTILSSRIAGSTARVLFPSGSSTAGSGRRHAHSESHLAAPSTPRTPRRTKIKKPSLPSNNHDLAAATPKSPQVGFHDHRPEPQTPTKTRHPRTSFPTTPAKNICLSISSPPDPGFEIFSDRKEFLKELNHPEASLSSHSHPHLAQPDSTPGMWYVFRGKKVFRPFPKDDPFMDIQPRKLFSEELAVEDQHASPVGSEEEDTDVEENKKITSDEYFLRKRPIAKKISPVE